MKIFTKENEEITNQNDITGKCDFECNNEYVYELINILLKDPLNKINAYKYLKTQFRFEYDDNDLIDYINNTYNTNYSKIYSIPTDETMISQIYGYPGNLSAYNLLRVDIKCAATDNFNLEDRVYTIAEVEELISSKALFPIKRMLTNIEFAPNKINVFNENEDKINYLVLKSQSKKDVPYYSYFVSKSVDFINLRNILDIVRENIILLYSYKLNKYYEDVYYFNSGISYQKPIPEEEYFKDVYDLINSFNRISISFELEKISFNKTSVFTYYHSDWTDEIISYFLMYNKLSIEEAKSLEEDIISRSDEELFDSIVYYNPELEEKIDGFKIANSLVEDYISYNEADEYKALEYLTNYKSYLNEKNVYRLLKIIYKSRNEEVIEETKDLGYSLEGCKTRSRKKKN